MNLQNWISFETVGGILLLQGSVNGVDGNVILDTGSQRSVINTAYFSENDKISPAPKTATTVDEVGNVVKSPICEVVIEEIRVGSEVFRNLEGLSLNLDYVEKQLKAVKEDVKVLGTIGMDIISQHTVSIDYRDRQIAFDAEIADDAQISPIDSLPNGLITTPVTVNHTNYPFIVDTGASVCVVEDELKNDLFGSWLDEKAGLFASTSFSVFGRQFSNVTFLNQNLGDIKRAACVYGIIGSCCLLDSVITIDCSNKMIHIS
ncbi:MAG: aspartyl protease family protein [Clostridiales bacterium]|nr:aspartyl protease family protein [Clostridiales bacterium]